MKQCYSHLLVFVLAFVGGCLAQSDGVSLGEVARTNRIHGKSVMVFNDENTHRSQLSDHPSPISADPSTTATSPVKAEAAKTNAGNQASTGSGADRDKLKKQLDSLKQQQSVWSNSVKDYEEKLANETSDFRRQVYEEALENDKQNVQLYQQKIDHVESELSKAQENTHNTGRDQADGASSPGRGNQP